MDWVTPESILVGQEGDFELVLRNNGRSTVENLRHVQLIPCAARQEDLVRHREQNRIAEDVLDEGRRLGGQPGEVPGLRAHEVGHRLIDERLRRIHGRKRLVDALIKDDDVARFELCQLTQRLPRPP